MRAWQEHASIGRRLLRLLRRACGGGGGVPLPRPPTGNFLQKGDAAVDMDSDAGEIVLIELAVEQRELMPCGGPVMLQIHCTVDYLEKIELESNNQRRNMGEGADSAAAVAIVLQNLIGCTAEAAETALQGYTGGKPVKAEGNYSSGEDSTWPNFIKTQTAVEVAEEVVEMEKGKQNQGKAPFFYLEYYSTAASEHPLAILHATKPIMPQQLVLTSQHGAADGSGVARRWSGLAGTRSRLAALCEKTNACVVGADVVINRDVVSIAWLVQDPATRDRGADRSILHRNWAGQLEV